MRRYPYKKILVNGEIVFEHRYVVEQYLGRKLLKGEVVHHINGIKTDNRIANLQVMTNQEHIRLHVLKRTEMAERGTEYVNLTKLRNIKNDTYADISKYLKISVAEYISKENGQEDFTLREVKRILQRYGKTFEEIFIR